MHTEADWKALDAERNALLRKRDAVNAQLKALKAERDELSKQIHSLSVRCRQHTKYQRKPPHTDTLVYTMFGKQLKDLTKEEYRIYYNACQRKKRARRKQEQQKEEA